MMPRRIPRVRQHDATDCGAACLRSVALHHGIDVSISKIRQLASTDRAGTNVMGLVEAAAALGLTAKGVRATPEALPAIPLPAIAHLELPTRLLHFVVIYRVGPGGVSVMDPDEGRLVRLPLDAFVRRWTGAMVLLAPAAEFARQPSSRSTYGRFWELARPHRSVLLQALVAATIYTILGLSTAIYVRLVVDHVIVDGDRNLLNLLSGAMLLILLLQLYFGSARTLLALHTGQKIDAVLLLGYYRHLLSLPQRFFDSMRVGEVISRMNDAVKIRAFINEAALDLTVHVLVVVFSFALMLAYNWKMALILVLALPLYGAVLWVTNRVNRQALRIVMERTADLESQLVETIASAATVKRYAAEGQAYNRAEARLVRLLRPVFSVGATNGLSAQATELVSRLTIVVLFWVGGGFVLGNQMSPGELLSFYALLGYLTGPMMQLVRSNRTIQDALIAADRLFEIMDLERESDGAAPAGGELPSGVIRFDGVRFRYGSRGEVLRGLDMELPRGAITALVGTSGSGKSTAIALLQKLYAPDSGRILVGDVDLLHISTATVRRRIACVPQEIDLNSANVLENIYLGAPEGNAGRAMAICRDLGLHEFIEGLPSGYGTMLGTAGLSLSAGQRQRIGIARALYRVPDVLLLDEASANLDAQAEARVQHCLRKSAKTGMTIVVVTHRISTAAAADRVIVIEEGTVREEGTHAELVAAGGSYADLWEQRYPPSGWISGDRQEVVPSNISALSASQR